ncbi:MAG: glycoside hydrolase family 3 C-terminal domain-containing protein [Lachnospiraceae bacterium]|nr:glycoside hydrolase family 3 C-terminal domain-containing protein [Lachnospiraceae bacterium]
MDIKKLVSEMTLEEKAGMCSGKDFWHLKGVERLGIPEVMVSDGPHGLRKQDQESDHLGINDSIVAVCFPAGCTTASSFDRDLIREMGETIGQECQAEDLSVVLGPAVNIKRSPLCGRNFEYLSEDPYLAGEMAASYIKGVQSKNVGVSIKHFALNNQEHERMSGSSEADERTMREIYFPAFEKAVKEADPWTVMCSYNRINGVFASENDWLLNKVLRDEWGFKGYVVSDWGAVNDRVEGVIAGLDLEMPASGGDNDKLIVEAVKNGRLPEEKLDLCVERILNIVYKYLDNKTGGTFDREADHEKSAKIAEQCMVLLKNEDEILPLQKNGKIAFIGGFAKKPRFQGGGSSHINSYKISNVLQESENKADIIYAEGFPADEDREDEALFNEALKAAKEADKVVIFAGLPDIFESEGYDRKHMRLPACQDKLIEQIASVNTDVVVVLHNGSPVEMPWIDKVKGILEAYLGGEAVGIALSRILFGEANPSGHLAETFPKKLSDNPSYLYFPGKRGKVFYGEGIFTGYRYYEMKDMEVLFPFGHGLSYTSFKIDNLKIERDGNKATDPVRVYVDVENTGKVAGKAVVQLYVADHTGTEVRPVKELKGFAKTELIPGEKKTLLMELDYRSFAYYSTEINDWFAPGGEYEILVGSSSADIAVSDTIRLEATKKLPFEVKSTTTFGELMNVPELSAIIEEKIKPYIMKVFDEGKPEETEAAAEAINEEMSNAMMGYMPLRGMRSFGDITNADIKKLVEDLNRALKG